MTTSTQFVPPAIQALPVNLNWKGGKIDEPSYENLLKHGRMLLAGLQRYCWYHIRPGNFLCHVLANDLFGAVMHADPISLLLLTDLVFYVRLEMPELCKGDMARVDAWAAKETL